MHVHHLPPIHTGSVTVSSTVCAPSRLPRAQAERVAGYISVHNCYCGVSDRGWGRERERLAKWSAAVVGWGHRRRTRVTSLLPHLAPKS